MKWFILGLLAFAGWAWWDGYRVHPENLHYYLKIDVGNTRKEVQLADGNLVTGVLEEDAADYIKLNQEGMINIYRKSQIVTMKSTAAPDFVSLMRRNYETYKKEHPLWTHKKEDMAEAKWDQFALGPSRIAEEMKKNNPGISATETLNQAMASAAQARQKMLQRQADIDAEAQR